ncbi:MAG: divalent metal cation transporter [Oscillospiraceae bacterium]|nr:divalent metal cation transporter [Oscillospiraceae bacterium]
MTKKAPLLLSAALLMATSAVGPGFLTQTANFTGEFQGSFGFVILAAALLAAIVQLNIWRVLCVSGLRGQDVANRLLPGLGYFVSFLVVLGGIVFNIGNVGGGALGFNALLGIPEMAGYFLTGGLAIAVFLMKDALKAMDRLVKVLAALMLLLILVVIFIVQPPVGMALKESIMPSEPFVNLFFPIITILGGTVGGYITFAGAHRMIDAKVTKEENLPQVKKTALMGVGIATLVRILLFLSVLGVVVGGHVLDASNPAADAFKIALGEIGYRFFGLVLFCAAITSVVGAAYTSVSFLKTFHSSIEKNEKWVITTFIAFSTIIMAVLGRPAVLLVVAGAFNGLILPVTLGVCLVASRNKRIMGESYKHPLWLSLSGIVVLVLTAYLGIQALEGILNLFRV